MSICINENRSYKYPTCIPDNVWGIQNGLPYIFNWAYHEPLCILRWFVNDPECIVKELLVNDHSSQLEALVRHEFKFMKDQINRGKIKIANMSIIDEYQELFTEVLNEKDDEIDAWANLLNDIVDHPINN
jgi:hypothetical protein